tara:strand:+ start:5304 stop:6287 length:984 start_codon:yes stop_codon:yes gene_type:complete
MEIKELYYKYNTRDGKPFELSPWFESSLTRAITRKDFVTDIRQLGNDLKQQLIEYRENNNVATVAIGMSGGIDSALTASLFKNAGWRVIGNVMPVHQNEAETERGIEVCKALDINYNIIDLTHPYDVMVRFYKEVGVDFDKPCDDENSLELRAENIRKGNIRARLRMITLYNLAAKNRGIVGSTDNFSELAAGFWTLHGDVGDVAPIQSLTKSWEVPALAEDLMLPSSVIEATPTDGLGIDSGDESQFGHTYAELDLALLDMLHEHDQHSGAELTDKDRKILKSVSQRIGNTVYKRANPINCDHPTCGDWRYQQLAQLDNKLIASNN